MGFPISQLKSLLTNSNLHSNLVGKGLLSYPFFQLIGELNLFLILVENVTDLTA